MALVAYKKLKCTAWSRHGRGCCFTLVALLSWLGTLFLASAATADEPAQPQYGWREMWAGADATKDVWLLYTGVTIAPFSDDIYSDGWRFRMAAGYGQYRYDAAMPVSTPCGPPLYSRCAYQHRTGRGTYAYTEALVGYHMRLGELTAKAFGGAIFASHGHDLIPRDDDLAGTEIGAKGVIELWLNLGTTAWTSLDASFTTAHDTLAARWRLGWRALPTLSIGPELRFDENAGGSASRAGAFIRYEWLGGELSLAGGVAGGMFDDADDMSPYGTLNVLFQY